VGPAQTLSPPRTPKLHVARARELRANMTGCERRLWSLLRTLRRSHGLHVRRQAPIGPFYADFVCQERRLVIEADGLQHEEASDARRDAWFARAGYRTLRFSNWEIMEDWDGVVGSIEVAFGLREVKR
jgi:very-short-patch-repair endonuclease